MTMLRDDTDDDDEFRLVVPPEFNRLERLAFRLLDHFDRLAVRLDRAARRRRGEGATTSTSTDAPVISLGGGEGGR